MIYKVVIYSPLRVLLRTIEFDYFRLDMNKNHTDREFMEIKGYAINAIISDIAEDIEAAKENLKD